MTSLHAKNVQSPLTGQNTALSTGYASNFPTMSRSSRRSHTTGKGYRTIDLQEHSFHYERACRDGDAREAIQSPYVNGRKNREYINPTYHSSLFLDQNVSLRRAKTPDNTDSRAFNPLTQSCTLPSYRVVSAQTPREDVVVSRKIDFTVESDRVESKENEKRAGQKSVSIREPVIEEVEIERIENPREKNNSAEKKLSASKSDKYLEVCGGCYNWQLAYEANEGRKRQREVDLDMEREVLDHTGKLLRNEQEREKQKKEALVATSRSNFETFSEKKTRKMSRDGREDDLEIKLNNKNMAAESIRSLKRYQSMLDKMYESSMNRHSENKGNLHKSQSHNKASITKNEQAKLQERQTLVKWNLAENEKSLLDTIHERSVQQRDAKDIERRIASEHNRKSSSARKLSAEDPFKADAGEYERASDGKSLMDKMYMSSMQYWKKQKDGLKDASQANKESSAMLKRATSLYDEEEMLAREYSSPGSARKPAMLKGKSMLDSIHLSDQKGLHQRKEGNLDCAGFNRSLGYSEEIAQLKAKNLENYYRSPARKVNKGDGVNYETWTEEGGVLEMISSSAEKLHQNRKAQTGELGPSIRQQIRESNRKKLEQALSEKNFKQTPLLVCSHKANMACCGICNRQVPANKITKLIADYSNLAKARGSVPKK